MILYHYVRARVCVCICVCVRVKCTSPCSLISVSVSGGDHQGYGTGWHHATGTVPQDQEAQGLLSTRFL